MMWKDFFYYTKAERRAVIILVVLILGVFAMPRLLTALSHPQEPDAVQQEQANKEYNEFIASLRETKPRPYAKNGLREYAQREIILTAFDPNTADSITFLSLGLPSWMAGNILRYRRKQGRFRRPQDFRKIYGLTEEQYQLLLPHIRIAEEFAFEASKAPRDTLQLLTAQSNEHERVFKYPEGTTVSLNTADTTELKKIPGIGSGIARRIVTYRNRLGAFHRIEQLQDIDLKAESLRPWFTIDAAHVRRINLNQASVERMMRHPYINFYQARAIVEYRKKKGSINSLRQLSLYEEFTAADIERMEPYVCFD